MSNFIFIPIVILSISAGLCAILITYQLQKKYRLGYLSAYLYFQIFINVFGLYGIMGQGLVKKILQQQASPFKTVETIGHFFSLLGIPFLILAWYMFIRLCREIVEKKLSRTFNLVYFLALIFSFLAYGSVIALFNLSDFGDEPFTLFSTIISFLYVGLQVLVLIIALSQLFIHSRTIPDGIKQKAIQAFAFLNVSVFGVSIIFFLLALRSSALAALYLLVFFSANIPPVLYWKAYLKKHYIAPVLQAIDILTMKEFFAEYNISKREEEVIQQMCEGKTNKEISETLFISLQTVKDHIYRIYQKTDVKNRVQLINLIQGYKNE
ncbi:MAG: helix-turn-helix transcriptional regulator [Candidatus Aminicenantes bacterium]|nr:helix-turn-helix transcriptional regulator [Candidatus Aminicenantes bacterium]MDH5466407.1 helix-turn-helix transcriptional regulator [Candidatus Aminicenantes bacterium]